MLKTIEVKKRNALTRRIIRFMPLYIMMVPGLIYLIINNYIPMAGIIVAFKRMNYRLGIFGSPWVGLSNFEFLFKTNDAWLITRNTLSYGIVFILLGTIVPVTVAIMLNEVRSERMRRMYQSVIMVPFMLSMVIISYLVFGFLSQESGFINNSILVPLGMSKVSWYAKPEPWPFILVLVNLWKGFGYTSLLYYSSVVSIDKTYFESAMIDGASKFKQIFYITLPLVRPIIIITTLIAISKIFFTDFGLFFQVPRNSGPLIDVTNTIDTYVYRGLVQNSNIGMSSAANFYQAIVGFVLVLTANLIVRKLDPDNSLF